MADPDYNRLIELLFFLISNATLKEYARKSKVDLTENLVLSKPRVERSLVITQTLANSILPISGGNKLPDNYFSVRYPQLTRLSYNVIHPLVTV